MSTVDEDADMEALANVASSIGRELPDDMRRALVTAYGNTLTRIRAALADREHLEEGARVLLASHELGLVRNTAYGAALDRWIRAERLRQSGKGGA